jgi:hypothetical protein
VIEVQDTGIGIAAPDVISCSLEDLLLRPQGGRELSSRGKEDFPISAQMPLRVTNFPNMI